MNIKFASEGLGYEWGHEVIIKLLNYCYGNTIISLNKNNYNIVFRSWCYWAEPYFNKNPKKYIYFSGETNENKITQKSNYHTKYLNIITNIPNNDIENTLYIPYFFYSPHLYKKRINTNINRKFLLAYCASNPCNNRVEFFNKFIEKTNCEITHSLGRNYGNYKKSHRQIGGDWKSMELINTFSNYTFVMAFENTKSPGYITEKIINAFYSGAIPIYWGSDNISTFFNEKAFIDVSNFKSFDECIDYILGLTKNDIQNYINEDIYKNTDFVNLINDDYNRLNNNLIKNEYCNKLKNLIEN